MENIHVGESIHETAMKVITSEHVISGFHPLRWSEAIHQLLSIRFNLTHSLSLSPGLYIFLHLHRPEADIISLLEEACYDENGLSDTLDTAHTAKPSQANLNMKCNSSLAAPFTFLWLFQLSFHFSWMIFIITHRNWHNVQLDFILLVLWERNG